MINRAQEGGSHQTGDSLSHTAGRPSKKAKAVPMIMVYRCGFWWHHLTSDIDLEWWRQHDWTTYRANLELN
ncbi:hypothetical protein RRG08_041021 [Elysia crispata]|uniref:Uncharacterized protein n=1 Tax=Elysia crispata TaxID=231223 RepID=A0AAE1EDF0_9GAST|nr:hypothetical protein RRG08_041021 [Elysia crispata]